jgi:hypothetical protein
MPEALSRIPTRPAPDPGQPSAVPSSPCAAVLHALLPRRPDDTASFVLGDAAHPMLPDVAGLYKLKQPPAWPLPQHQQHHQAAQAQALQHAQALQQQREQWEQQREQQPLHVFSLTGSWDEVDAGGRVTHLGAYGADGSLQPPNAPASPTALPPPPAVTASSPAVTPRRQAPRPAARRASVAAAAGGPRAGAPHPAPAAPSPSSLTASASAPSAAGSASLRSALLQFMNHPHPLTTLSEYAAYGPNGSISRYHNPDNYTKGLQSVLAASQRLGGGQ